jgi:uncharacterized repeat protein (TIGR03803 family)
MRRDGAFAKKEINLRIVGLAFCCVVFASCSHASGSSPIPPPLSGGALLTQQAQPFLGSGYKSLYSFKGSNAGDGAFPYAGLTALSGTLYGTTALGGGGKGFGTLFKATTSGKESVVHAFSGTGGDGSEPQAALADVNGTLYGTTVYGGSGKACSGGCGTVFKVGAIFLYYNFVGTPDGSAPLGNLIDVKGTFYGTTGAGGSGTACSGGCGTVFKIVPSKKSFHESVLYSFKGGKDGADPTAGLIALNGTLYGTTYQGGGAKGYGTVFKITTSGKESVLYSFKGGKDGTSPSAGLIEVNGLLYGTASKGGKSLSGVVFTITTSGKESVLYTFKGGKDGGTPFAALIDVNGTLYGTTLKGGGKANEGTVFKISTSGKESVLYGFKGGKDGAQPWAELLNVNGTLYGTTTVGGRSGFGTIFRISP